MSTHTSGPERLQRFIELMMRHWVTNDSAHEDNGALRLQTFVDRIGNALGLKVVREMRYFDGGRPMMAYHLPHQTRADVQYALSQLTPLEANCGFAIRQLHNAHPFIGGDIPVKPGISQAENKLMPKVIRGDGGRVLHDTLLELLKEPNRWLTSAYVMEHYGSTRLAMMVRRYRQDGINVDDEDRPNANGKGVHRAYHIFTNPGERDAWLAEFASKSYVQREAKAKSSAPTQPAKPVRKTSATSNLAGGSQFGGWKKAAGATPAPRQNTATVRQLFPGTGAPTRPPTGVMDRLSSLQNARQAPQAQSRPVEMASAPDVPAAALNQAYPMARSKDVVEFNGGTYTRRFRPRKEGEKIVAWEANWEAQWGSARPHQGAST